MIIDYSLDLDYLSRPDRHPPVEGGGHPRDGLVETMIDSFEYPRTGS